MRIFEIENPLRDVVETNRFRKEFNAAAALDPSLITDLRDFIEFKKVHGSTIYGSKDAPFHHGPRKGYWHWHLRHGKLIVTYWTDARHVYLTAFTDHKAYDGKVPKIGTFLSGLSPNDYSAYHAPVGNEPQAPTKEHPLLGELRELSYSLASDDRTRPILVQMSKGSLSGLVEYLHGVYDVEPEEFGAAFGSRAALMTFAKKVLTDTAVKEAINESVGTKTYLHVAPADREESIATRGLIANGGDIGNYSGDFQSLEGVYLTDDVNLIEHMMKMRDDLEPPVMLAVIEADPSRLLPDEDIINILIGEIHDSIPDAANYGTNAKRKKIIKTIGERFALKIGEKPSKQVNELAEMWLDHWEGGEVDPYYWSNLKDVIVRRHPTRSRDDSGGPQSLRYPGDIGFTGSPRIVTLISIDEDMYGKVRKGQLTEAGRGFLQQLGVEEAPIGWKASTARQEALSGARAELLVLARRALPHRPEDELRDIISRMDDAQVAAQTAKVREMIASGRS